MYTPTAMRGTNFTTKTTILFYLGSSDQGRDQHKQLAQTKLTNKKRTERLIEASRQFKEQHKNNTKYRMIRYHTLLLCTLARGDSIDKQNKIKRH
mmetsp:Transcript_30504/g.65450  ORF Transcript_30504/g.65450 Transcript_30504/m.65450 type:complete len:95 (+) Transcript_30504:411-695(+)